MVLRLNIRKVACALLLVCACALCAASLNGCTQEDKSYSLVAEGTLTVATASDYAPFESLDESGQAQGFDVALAKEAASRLGLACTVVPQDFDGVLDAVSDDKTCDVALSALTITDKRTKQVDFTDAYYVVNQCIVVAEGAYVTADELEDLAVAAPVGTTSYDYALDTVSDKTVKYTTAANCLAAVQSGEVQAAVVEYPVACAWMKENAGCTMLEQIALGNEYGIAVSKDNARLTEALNEVLRAMDEDGTLQRLEQEYLS